MLFSIEKEGNSYSFVSGGCPKGADKFAEVIAKELNIAIKIFYPDNSLLTTKSKSDYTKMYYARNLLIAKYSDELIALPLVGKAGGTDYTIKQFVKLKNKNPIIVY